MEVAQYLIFGFIMAGIFVIAFNVMTKDGQEVNETVVLELLSQNELGMSYKELYESLHNNLSSTVVRAVLDNMVRLEFVQRNVRMYNLKGKEYIIVKYTLTKTGHLRVEGS